MNSLNILTTERTSNWALEIADQGDGTIAITGISVGTALAPGDGPVCRAVLYPVAEEEMTVSLSYTSGTSIQDADFIDLNWTSESSTYEVGIETQYLNLYGGMVRRVLQLLDQYFFKIPSQFMLFSLTF